MYAVLREDAFLGETHIVTGSGQGIGFAVATLLAQHGAQVAMVDASTVLASAPKAGVMPTVPLQFANHTQLAVGMANALPPKKDPSTLNANVTVVTKAQPVTLATWSQATVSSWMTAL